MLRKAVIIGNGTSRRDIDLHQLRSIGTIYGCNALYRDFSPDILVAVDEVMVRELSQNKVYLQVPIYTTYYNQIPGDFNFFTKHPGMNSGHAAAGLAADHGHKEVYLLGFDYIGTNSLINNIYADSRNYSKSTNPEAKYTHWLIELTQLCQQHPTTKFIRINGNNYIPECTEPNLINISIQQFKEMYEL